MAYLNGILAMNICVECFHWEEIFFCELSGARDGSELRIKSHQTFTYQICKLLAVNSHLLIMPLG